MPLEVDAFAKGFVAALVELDHFSIQPKRPEDLRALARIRALLGDEADKAEGDPDSRDWFKSVVRLRNSLSPGQTGSFDRFETALRDLQLSFTESPNVNYEDIVFTVSKPFAVSALAKIPERERQLVRTAARAFIDNRI